LASPGESGKLRAMKKVLFALATLLVLVGITLWIWNQPPLIPSVPYAQKSLEARVSRLEAAVEKLQRETSPRVIPLAKDE
jgi:uncharacterized protein YxeA